MPSINENNEAISMHSKAHGIRVYWMIIVSLRLNSTEKYNLDKGSRMVPFLKK